MSEMLTRFSTSALCLIQYWNIPLRVTVYVRARPSKPALKPMSGVISNDVRTYIFLIVSYFLLVVRLL